MPIFSKRSLLLALSALALATLLLTIHSHYSARNLDISIEGSNWACFRVGQGGLLAAYVAADAAPRLRAIPFRTSYFEKKRDFQPHVQWKAMLSCDRASEITEIELRLVRAKQRRGLEQESDELRQLREDKNKAVADVDLRMDALETKHQEEVRTVRAELMNEAERICRPISFAGFFVSADTQPREVVLRIPLAALILLFGFIPSLSFANWLRTRVQRRRQNLCLNCAYNLTGNTSGICPECGKAIHQKGR